MAFNDKSGGPWGGGPENRNGPGGGNPWGSGNNQNNNPDLEDIIRKGRERFKRFIPMDKTTTY